MIRNKKRELKMAKRRKKAAKKKTKKKAKKAKRRRRRQISILFNKLRFSWQKL